MCLEKIQRANDLMGLNDSSPGEQLGRADEASLAHPGQASELPSQPPATSRRMAEGTSPWMLQKAFGAMAFWICPGQWRWGCPPWGWPALSGRGCSGWTEVAAFDPTGAGYRAGLQLPESSLAGGLGLVAAGTQLLQVHELASTWSTQGGRCGSFPTSSVCSLVRSQRMRRQRDPRPSLSAAVLLRGPLSARRGVLPSRAGVGPTPQDIEQPKSSC